MQVWNVFLEIHALQLALGTVVFYNKLLWFVSDISGVQVVQLYVEHHLQKCQRIPTFEISICFVLNCFQINQLRWKRSIPLQRLWFLQVCQVRSNIDSQTLLCCRPHWKRRGQEEGMICWNNSTILTLYWVTLSVLNCSPWRSSKDHLLAVGIILYWGIW